MDAEPLLITSEARVAAATELRALAHALVAHQVDEATLVDIAQTARGLRAACEASPDRRGELEEVRIRALAARSAAGDPFERHHVEGSLFADSFVSGQANPMGLNAHMSVEGDESVARVTLGAAFEGAPGRCHGGVVAALIDETMGGVLQTIQAFAFTGRLSVTYRAATPLHVPLECRARVLHREGRKLTIAATLRSGEDLLVEAEALFIIVDPTRWA